MKLLFAQMQIKVYLITLFFLITMHEANSAHLHTTSGIELKGNEDTLYFKQIRKPWRKKALVLGQESAIIKLNTGNKLKCVIAGSTDSMLIIRKFRKMNSSEFQKLSEEKKKITGTYSLLKKNKKEINSIDSLKNSFSYPDLDTISVSTIDKIKVRGKLIDIQRKKELVALGTLSSLGFAAYLSIKANLLSLVPSALLYENSVGIRLLLAYPILLFTLQKLSYKNVIRFNKWTLM